MGIGAAALATPVSSVMAMLPAPSTPLPPSATSFKPFLGWARPRDPQRNGYVRYLFDHKVSGIYTFEAVIPSAPLQPPRVRLTMNGVPFTQWLLPPYVGSLDTSTLPDGSHLLGADVENDSLTVIELPVRVRNGAAPITGPQKIWIAPSRYELGRGLAQGSVQIDYPGAPPVLPGHPHPARVIEPYGTRLANDELWVSRLGMYAGGFVRRFTSLPDGDVAILPRQMYFHSDMDDHGIALIDGPRNVGTLGHAIAALVHPQGRGFYGLSVNGRVWFIGVNGHITTLVGWRLKAGRNVPYWRAIRTHRDWYDEQFDYVGRFLDGPDHLNEPWDIAARETPGEEGFHELFVTDTRNHRVVYIDHHPAHVPGGESHVSTFAGNLDGTPGLLNEPWGCDLGPDGYLYVSNYASGSIVRIAPTGKMELVVETSLNVSDAELGIAKRGASSRLKPSEIRSRFSRDGAFGRATLIRPQALRFTSTGKLIVAERYTFALREIDLQARTIRTLAILPRADLRRHYYKEVTLSIDKEGTCGPVDDMFVCAWGPQAAHRFAADGTHLGAITTGSGGFNRGPATKVRGVAYPWATGVGKGMILLLGSGAEHAILITKRQPTDPTPDVARYERGLSAYKSATEPALLLTHGPNGQGQLGFPTFDEMGTWSDPEILAYLGQQGLTPQQAGDLLYAIRWDAV